MSESPPTEGAQEPVSSTRPPLVSVVVPAYNVRKYLDRCVESLLAQTFPHFELILVDDGSADGTGERCDEWARRDSRIRVIHQPNSGQAAARNRAVERCAGEWVAFVDADDFVDAGYLEYLLRLTRDHGADLSSCGLFETDGRPIPPSAGDSVDVLGPSEACLRLLRGEGLMDGPCCKLFRRDSLLACPFPEGRVYEDTAVMGRLVHSATRVAVGSRTLYGYFRNPGGTTASRAPGKLCDQLWANRTAAEFFDGAGEGAAARLAWDKLKKTILFDVKKNLLPLGVLRAFWRECRDAAGPWDVLGIKCRVALAVPFAYRMWTRLARS